MRKISREAYEAFMAGKTFNKSNTRVITEVLEPLGTLVRTRMYLFNNEIARKEGDNVFISDGEYRASATTRDRLSAFVDISIYKGNFIINNRIKWNGEWTNINEFS